MRRTEDERDAAELGAGPAARGRASEDRAPALPPPVLHLRGEREGRVRLALAVARREGEAPPAVALEDGAPLAPRPIGRLGGARFWRVEFERPRAAGGGLLRLDGAARRFSLPEPGASLRLAFASCNGTEHEPLSGGGERDRNAMWAHLAARHAARPFHLLALGGDQIYADAVWEAPSLAAWRALPRRARLRAPFTEAMRREADAFYLARYAATFGAAEVAGLLGAIPTVMMWDDHDIFDGWGSHPPEIQDCPVFQGLFAVARRAFALIQLGRDPERPWGEGAPDPLGPDAAQLGWAGAYGPAWIVAPDLRSERTRRRVLGPAGEGLLRRALDPPEGLPHLLLVSSVPMVNADLSAIERVLGPLQRLVDLYQDDLRDQWMSHAHAGSWSAAMDRLLALAAGGRTVSVVSGEIHFAALGSARGTGARAGATAAQFIASGVAHPPPPRFLARLLERFARRPWTRRGVRLAMHPIGPEGQRYLAERNWLEMELRPDGGRRAWVHGERSGTLPLAPPVA